jgi:hypothetical protein
MAHVVILPHVIEKKLKVDERQEVITFINELLSDTSTELKRDVIEIVEEKFERRLSEEIVNLKADLTEKIVNNKAEMIKWMFIFWIGNVLTVVGGMIGLLKLAKVF